MKYVIRTFLGMTLFAFCWVALGYSINQLLGVGTCASGGPYVSARPCPDGTVALMWTLTGAIFGMFIAAGIYLSRGSKPPGGAPPPDNAGIVVWFWTGVFWSLAVGCFLGVWGPDANPGPGGKTGGLVVGFMGLFMGAGGLLALTFGRRRRRKPPGAQFTNPVVTGLASTATRFSGAADPVSRLDVLDRLRGQGTLTDAEFETLKSKIVRED